jgi:hypothetical protein
MRSVADDVGDDQIREIHALTPSERLKLASRLGEEGILFFMEINGVDRAEAVRQIKTERSTGRVPSKSKRVE